MKITAAIVLSLVLSLSFGARAADYIIDGKGVHSFVQFKTSHMGFGWVYGQFLKFNGDFSYDPANDAANKISMVVDATSLFTNNADRDGLLHLRSDKYLDTEEYPTASFTSTSYKTVGEKKAVVTGNLTLLGVTKQVSLDVDVLGGGKDPWGGYRQAFEARTKLKTADFGMKAAQVFPELELIVSIEGCKKPNPYCGTD